MNNRIVLALRDLGVPANILGYEYLKSAIGLCLDDNSYLDALTRRLYPEVAKRFGTTPSRVERATRHAIKVTWDRRDPDQVQRYFGKTVSAKHRKPTSSEFIATIAEQLRMEREAAE